MLFFGSSKRDPYAKDLNIQYYEIANLDEPRKASGRAENEPEVNRLQSILFPQVTLRLTLAQTGDISGMDK